MASNSGGGGGGVLLLMMFALFGVGAIILLSRMGKGRGMNPNNTTNLQVGVGPDGRISVIPNVPTYGTHEYARGQIFGINPGTGKPGPLITSGSESFRDMRDFTSDAVGTCQCDDRN